MASGKHQDEPVPACSVVVCTRDRPGLLRQTLLGLVEHVRSCDEIIVVDSASSVGSVDEVVEGILPDSDVRLGVVRLDIAGASRARNAGLISARAPVVIFTDDDCLVTEGWTRRIEAAFADPAVGFVTGQVRADREVNLPLSVVTDQEPHRFAGPGDPARYGTGGNMAFRRSALTGVRGFDESLGPGTRVFSAEDQDALWRVVRAGWVGVFDPTVVVYHQQWIGRRGALRRSYQYGVGAGAVATKVIRMGSGEGWQILLARLWRDGVVRTLRHLRAGYEWGALAGAIRLPGVMVGILRGVTRDLDGEHFVGRTRRREALITGGIGAHAVDGGR